MKTLTIITVIALPMTVITSFFGMNFDQDIPLWHWMLKSPAGFFLSMSVIIGLVLFLLYLFRRNKWL